LANGDFRFHVKLAGWKTIPVIETWPLACRGLLESRPNLPSAPNFWIETGRSITERPFSRRAPRRDGPSSRLRFLHRESMAAQFAGSRSLDERRRRRIAGTWDEDAATPPPLPGGTNPETAISAGNYTPRNRRRLPLQRIIPARFWKHAVIAGFVLAVGVGIFALDRQSRQIAQSLGPSAGDFASARTGRLLPFFSGVLLAVSAELSLLIGWVRSRSRTDFSGRFRIWRWASAAGFLLAATVLLDLHLLWSRTLIWRLKLDFAHAETLCWLAPAIGCGSVLIRDLLADIRGCRGSSTFLWLAVVSWGASVTVLLGGGEFIEDATWLALAVRSAATFGYYCLFVSLLLQARFVLFVSAEPPAQCPSLAARSVKTVLRVAMRPMYGAAGLLRRKQNATAADGRRKSKRRRNEEDAGPPVRVNADTSSGTQAFVTKDFQDSRRVSGDNTSGGKRTLRVDEPHELRDLAGDGKKASRRSRKHKRSKSRASS
jgi:hypothetical protein